jgi:hypothetical protein
MKTRRGNGLKRTLLVLGLSSALAACSSSSPQVADGGFAGAAGGSAGAAGGSAGAAGSDLHADDGGDARLDGGDDGLSCLSRGAIFPGAKCADTFDAQKASQPPLPNTMPYVASGACGGYLVWLNAGMLYALACIYDPTTKNFVGERYADDQGDTCTGVGTDFPRACLNQGSYPAPAAAH